ncbi:hypothetical protein [Streptomyces sp. NPDC056670]|uniref:hypothetical protein n=1 Tax=Streptomyces sp. NPDC056670 TaxID=3345904 RepID=UPI00368BFC80
MTTDLDGIRARVVAASPLPWVIVPRSCTDHGEYYDLHGGRASDDPAVWWLNEIATHQDGDEGVPLDKADAEFLVHAREDIPALLALVGKLIEERDRFHGAWHNARDRAASAQADVKFMEARAPEAGERDAD